MDPFKNLREKLREVRAVIMRLRRRKTRGRKGLVRNTIAKCTLVANEWEQHVPNYPEITADIDMTFKTSISLLMQQLDPLEPTPAGKTVDALIALVDDLISIEHSYLRSAWTQMRSLVSELRRVAGHDSEEDMKPAVEETIAFAGRLSVEMGNSSGSIEVPVSKQHEWWAFAASMRKIKKHAKSMRVLNHGNGRKKIVNLANRIERAFEAFADLDVAEQAAQEVRPQLDRFNRLQEHVDDNPDAQIAEPVGRPARLQEPNGEAVDVDADVDRLVGIQRDIENLIGAVFNELRAVPLRELPEEPEDYSLIIDDRLTLNESSVVLIFLMHIDANFQRQIMFVGAFSLNYEILMTPCQVVQHQLLRIGVSPRSIKSVVSESGNMELLNWLGDGVMQIPSVCHILAEFLNGVCLLEPLNGIREKALKVGELFRDNSILRATFCVERDELGVKGTFFKKHEFLERWGERVVEIQHYLKNRAIINNIAELREHVLTAREVQAGESVTRLLEQVLAALKEFKLKTSSASEVLPRMAAVEHFMANNICDGASQEVYEMFFHITKDLVSNEHLQTATFLDPRFAHLEKLFNMRTVRACLMRYDRSQPVQQPRAARELSPLSQYLEDAEGGPMGQSPLCHEIEVFRSLPRHERPDSHSDPLVWWRANRRRYPILTPIAKKYLAIPSYSVDSQLLLWNTAIIAGLPMSNEILSRYAAAFLSPNSKNFNTTAVNINYLLPYHDDF